MAAVLCAFVIYILLPGDTSAITDKETCGSFFEVQDGELETYERADSVSTVSPLFLHLFSLKIHMRSV